MDDQYKQFDHVYHIYNGKNGKFASVSTNDNYGVVTPDGRLMKMNERMPAKIYAALQALYGDIPLVEDRQVVPFQIAVNGKPAIAAYQYMAHYQYYNDVGTQFNAGKREIAELMGISYETIQKYLRRVARKAEQIKIGGEREHQIFW